MEKDTKGESLYLLRVLCDDRATVFLNGKPLAHREGHTQEKYVLFELEQNVRDQIVPGKNTLAVHCHNLDGPGYIDVGLYALTDGSLALAKRRFAAMQIADPWLKLAGAYAVTGHSDEAVPYFRKALDGTDNFDTRKAIVEHVVGFDKILDSLVKQYPAELQLQLAVARNLAERGKSALAAGKAADALATLKQSQDLFTKLLAPRQTWTVLAPIEMKTENGSRLELQKDGSIFVDQPAKKDIYALVFQTELKGIKGLRLEALTDSRLPGGGSGWAAGAGNFVLNELTLRGIPTKTPDQPGPIALRNASASFSQQGRDIRGTVDGNDGTGWAVWPETGKDHTAVFDLAEEVGDGQASRLTVRIHHQHGDPNYLLGRFRLSCTTDAATLQTARLRFDLKDSEVVDLFLTLAKAHAQQGQSDKAVAAYAQALAMVKDGAGRARIIAEAAAMKGTLEKLAESVSKDGPFQSELAHHFADQGNKPLANVAHKKARALFEQQLKAEPDNSAPASDLAELLLRSVNGTEHFWIDDTTPTGAKLQGETPWEWVTKPAHPVLRGQKATRRQAQGVSQHYFDGATARLKLGHGAKLFAYVYLDPKDPPKTVMMQFKDGSWEHRVFWGEDLIPYGMGGKESHLSMGPLPKAGEWVRLEVEAAKVGLHAGANLNGWSFTQHGGTCYWDAAGGTNCTTCFESPWLTLAAAYAATGENDRAVQYASKALKAADSEDAKKAIFGHLAGFDRVLDSLAKEYPAELQLQLALARNLAARGKTAQAAGKATDALAPLKQAQDLFTRLLAPRQAWTVLTPLDMKTESGTNLELQKDGSVFAHQPVKKDTYVLVFQTELKGIKGLRLEALSDARLPGGGPGCATGDAGNFVLNELTLHAATAKSPDQPRPIALRNASADFSQPGWDVRGAVDGNGDTGWAIAPEFNKDHTALFDLAEDVGDGKATRLTIRLSHQFVTEKYEKYLLGRFRLSLTNDSATLHATRIRLDLKDSEVVEVSLALAKAHAQLGQSNETVAAFARTLAHIGDERQTGSRFLFARAATLVGVGQGKEAPNLDDTAKAKLRRYALDGLKAELTLWTKQLEAGPSENIVQTLNHWQKEPDLAGIREAAALAKLSADERTAFTQLWADVTTLLKKAEEKSK
jgi:tetratricopeptide (TPR) repeat protein